MTTEVPMIDITGLDRQLTDIDPGVEFDPDLYWHVEQWCRRYFQPSGQDPLLRYNIGIYQIHQLRVAKADMERARSSAAGCVIHVLSAAAILGADCSAFLPERFTQIEDAYSPEALVGSLTAATQQHCYLATCKPGTVRYARIDKSKLAQHTAGIIRQAMAMIPRGERVAGMREEMDRLVSFEWKRK